MMRCAMCGYEFDATGLACHTSCPLGSQCMVICCPHCGYSTVNPARSRLLTWVERWIKRPAPRLTRPAAPGPLSLLDLAPGQAGRVVALGDSEPDQLLHLSDYGLMPGAPVRLCQRRPTPIIQVGETELALDASLAADVYVELINGL